MSHVALLGAQTLGWVLYDVIGDSWELFITLLTSAREITSIYKEVASVDNCAGDSKSEHLVLPILHYTPTFHRWVQGNKAFIQLRSASCASIECLYLLSSIKKIPQLITLRTLLSRWQELGSNNGVTIISDVILDTDTIALL